MSGRLILGIETVTRIGSLAAVRDGEILEQVTIDTELNHTAKLISTLDTLGVRISDVDAIAVDIGPGSFTGIRVGISTAMGLAQPFEIPLIGVCSLEVLCCKVKVPEGVRFLVPVIDAKRGLFYSATYGVDGSVIKRPYLTTKENLPQGFHFGPEIDNTYPDAGTVAKIGEQKIKEGKAEKDIEPMYLHAIEYRI